MHEVGTRVLNTLTSLLPSVLDLPYFPLTESETEGSVDTSMWIHDVSSVHVTDLEDRHRIEVGPGGICGRYQVNSSPFHLLGVCTWDLEIEHALGSAHLLVHV